MKLLALPVLVAAVTIGCGKSSAKAPPPPPADGVQDLNPGAEPREPLRYALTKGTRSAVELALDVDINAGGQGGPLPTLAMTTDIAILDVASDGTATLQTTIRDVVARERAGSPISADTMTTQTQVMRGLVMTGKLAPNGRLVDMKVDLGGRALPPGLASQLDTLSKSFEQVAMPLPAAPVGTGAIWMHTKELDQGGMKMTTATTVTLVGRTADTFQFTSTTVVAGKDQSVTQAGTTVEVKDLHGSGSGKGTVDLGKVTLTGDITAEFTADMSSQGQTASMGMKMTTRMTPAASAPPSTPPSTPPVADGSAGGSGSAIDENASDGSAGSGDEAAHDHEH